MTRYKINPGIILSAVVSSALLLSGCTASDSSETTSGLTDTVSGSDTSADTDELSKTIPETSSYITESETIPEPEGIMKASPEYFPVKTDGSTSAIAIDAAVKAAYIGGFTGKDLEPFITHSKTYGAFVKLVAGETDAIYSVPLSAEQIEYAEEHDFRYECVPVAREAFVFVVNAKNPVNSLTSEELREIYSGQITNWNEVGGNDSEPELYLRNENSGSGSYFRDFMGDLEPATGQRTYISGHMGNILDAVASYDNGPNAIGFSVYSFVTQMYQNSSELKMLSVDGIEPCRETIMNETYPLSSCTYFIFSANEPENSEVRKLADFIKTEKAQSAIEETGYMRIY